MTVEHKPAGLDPLAPAPETVREMSFGTAVRKAVDDLFTCADIAQKVQALPPNDVVPVLLAAWKQGLTAHLQQQAQAMVENVSAILDILNSDEPLAPIEPLEWSHLERWHTPYPIASLSREDLRGVLPDETILGLDDQQMTQIAAQMGQVFYENRGYWDNLTAITQATINQQPEAEMVSTESVETTSPTDLASILTPAAPQADQG